MKKAILFFLILLNLSCSSDNDSKFQEQTITVDLIGKENLYSHSLENIPEQNITITNQTDWEILIAKMDAGNNTTANFTTTSIDFNNYQLIAVFDEPRHSHGFSIEIMSITEKQSEIVVDVERFNQGSITNAASQPFHIVKIPIQDKPIVFE